MTGPYARFFCAFTFLTRLRLPGAKRIQFTPAVLTGSVAYYPVVGLFYSLVSLGIWCLGNLARMDATLTAFALLAAPYLINRFLHFDGLCDVLDAFLADKSPEQRLDIMKDSRNGSFAMGGAVLLVLLKYLAILNLVGSGGLLPLLLAPPLLRTLVVAMAWRARYPRPTGTAFHLVGQVSPRHLAACLIGLGLVWTVLISVMALLGGLPPAVWPAAKASLPSSLPAGALGLAIPSLATMAWTAWLRWTAGKKIGGVTGDVLGCLIESGEAVFFLGGLAGLAVVASGVL
jgi:adenosylcobinamide-GDP ribazoletransferase